MSTESTWKVVAGREVSTRIRDKGFLGGTAFMLVLVAVVFVVVQIVSGRASTYDVAVIDDTAAAATKSADSIVGAGSDDSVSVERVDTADDAEQAVSDGDVDVALLPADAGYELVAEDEADDKLASALATGVSRTVIEANAQQQGVDLDELQAGTSLDKRSLDPDASTSDVRSGIGFAFVLIFYVTALSFGMMISQSVVQEKESRVVEILAAAVQIRALLWGKIAGNTLLGLAQVVLVVAAGLIGLAVTGRTELLSGVGPAAAWYVVFFVLGFVTLASLWSVAGSIASRQQDLQNTTLPGQAILFAPYLIAVFAGGQVKTVLSMFPVVSSMLIPSRMVEDHVPLWQIGVAIVVTVAAAIVFVRIGTRLYERTLLRTGRSIGYREAFKLEAD